MAARYTSPAHPAENREVGITGADATRRRQIARARWPEPSEPSIARVQACAECECAGMMRQGVVATAAQWLAISRGWSAIKFDEDSWRTNWISPGGGGDVRPRA